MEQITFIKYKISQKAFEMVSNQFEIADRHTNNRKKYRSTKNGRLGQVLFLPTFNLLV